MHRFKRTAFQNICKRYWGFVPLCGAVLAGAVLGILQAVTGWTLRTVPREILCVLGAVGIVTFLLWVNVKLWQMTKKRENKPFWLCIVRNVLHLVSIAGVLVLGFYFFILMGFAHTPEHVVEKNGIKTVARVNSFLDKNVDYYVYKNSLFYGKSLGHEWYGSGGSDPLDAEPPLEPKSWMFYDLDGNMLDYGPRADTSIYGAKAEKRLSDPEMQAFAGAGDFNTRAKREEQSGILTFASPPAKYIDSYNGIFYAEKYMRYFPKLEKWYGYRYDVSARNEPQLIHYYFTEDTYDASCPKLSVYTAGADQAVRRIEICYDDSYDSQEMWTLQQDMFKYTLYALFKNNNAVYLARDDIYRTLTASAYNNSCSNFEDAVPGGAVKVLCYQGSVGIYSYVINGFELHICFVPLTEELLREYESQGVTLYDIAKDFK